MSDWKSALAAISQALNVVSQAAGTPGINLIPYVGTVSAAAAALNAALAAGLKVAPYILAISRTFSGGLPDEAQRAELDAKIAELEAKVSAPLPPKEDGEPD